MRITNSSATSVLLDLIVDTLPAGFTYVAGSSRYNGAVILDPNVSGSVLTWSDNYTNPPASSRDLTFQAIPTAGGYATNSVVAYSGSTLIDTTLLTSDNAPAKAGVRALLAPTAVSDSGTTLEDTALTVPASGVLVNDVEPNGFAISVVSYTQPAHGSVTVNANGSYAYQPATNYNGSDSFTYTLTNGNGRSATATVTLTVTAVNDPPSFTAGTNQTVLMNAGAQTSTSWATSITPGPANESSQTNAFRVSNNNTNLFAVQPSISSNGTLTYTPAANTSGLATVTVYLQDSGGTANGGSDVSASQTFTILVVAYSLGNRVFDDLNNDGDMDAGESGISGVQLALFAANGAGSPTGSVLATTVSDLSGDYRFDNLAAGAYVVVVNQAASATLSGYVSSTGNSTNVDLGSDMKDHGKDTPVSVGTVTNGIVSVAVTVGPGLQPFNEVVANPAGAGQHGPCGDLYDNLAMDFGFTPTYSLGNRVFSDANNNGIRDVGDSGISGVRMALFSADGSGNPTGSALAFTNTDTSGYYRFDSLVAGTYAVMVDKAGSSSLNQYWNSVGASTNTSLSGDETDHGRDTPMTVGTVTNGIAGNAVTLGAGLQPAGEATNTVAGAHGPNGDASDNLTMDFGFTPTFSIGNRVFNDNGQGSGGVTNDGVLNGTEPGITNVLVKLFAADGSGTPTGSALASTNTDASGYYRFDTLAAGTFVVVVDVAGSSA
ncbi:MAG: SdrD B-like domain-containing protein, partial [bacterium]